MYLLHWTATSLFSLLDPTTLSKLKYWHLSRYRLWIFSCLCLYSLSWVISSQKVIYFSLLPHISKYQKIPSALLLKYMLILSYQLNIFSPSHYHLSLGLFNRFRMSPSFSSCSVITLYPCPNSFTQNEIQVLTMKWPLPVSLSASPTSLGFTHSPSAKLASLWPAYSC